MDYTPNGPLGCFELGKAGESVDLAGHFADICDALDGLHDLIDEFELLLSNLLMAA